MILIIFVFSLNKDDMQLEPENHSEQSPPARPLPKWKRYLKRFGILVFIFYLVKGIVWLIIFYFGGKLLLN